jgi:hypothetical protein
MESTKNIIIKDMDNKMHFRIRLFDCEKGLDFIDNLISRIKSDSVMSVKPYLDDLLPLAALLDNNGREVVAPSLTKEECYSIFQNPLSILELGMEIFKFQEVFLKNSEAFRGLEKTLGSIWNTKVSG